MEPGREGYDVDWVIASASDVHVAQHRDWFKSYTPFVSTVSPLYGGEPVQVCGVGDVELKLERPECDAEPSFSTITLRDVVYIPNGLCNIITPLCPPHIVVNYYSRSVCEADGRPIGIFDTPRLAKLRLHGQHPNQTHFDTNSFVMASVHWGPEEWARWLDFKASHVTASTATSGSANVSEEAMPYLGAAPYTDKENRWLKKYYGNEFKFLTLYQLSIHSDDEREEGRAIARTLIANDEASERA